MVSKSKLVAALAVLPASSVMSTATDTFPSMSVPPETSTVQSPLLPAVAAAVAVVPLLSVSVTVTLEASASTPDSVRVTFPDSASLITVSTATARSKLSSASAVVSKSKLVEALAVLPASSVTVALTVT